MNHDVARANPNAHLGITDLLGLVQIPLPSLSPHPHHRQSVPRTANMCGPFLWADKAGTEMRTGRKIIPNKFLSFLDQKRTFVSFLGS